MLKEILENMDSSYKREDDYYCEETKKLRCKVCKDFREMDVEFDGGKVDVPLLCKCMKEEKEKENLEKKKQEFEFKLASLERKLNIDTSYKNIPEDDGTKKNISSMVEKYVENFNSMYKENLGLLFYGSVGSGKSFYAKNIVKKLQAKNILATCISLSTMVVMFQNFDVNKIEILDALNSFDLIVIDDVGSERNTSFATEIVYTILESRLNSKKPTIFTTNLSLETLNSPRDITYKRIYERIIEMCVKVEFKGKSKRDEISKEKTKLARKILYN